METIKISQLPESESFEGLYALGVDSQNRSVKISLDELADNAAVLEEAEEILGRMEEFDGRVRPAAMSVPDEYNVPLGGSGVIPVTITPSNAMRNIIYQVDEGSSVKVRPDGVVRAISTGVTSVNVIPAENTALWKQVQVKTYGQTFVMSGDAFRVTADNQLRLN